MMKREMPSLEEQEAVAWYVLERPLVRPNTSYRKAAFYVSLFLAVNSGITILLYYLLRWLGVSSFLPQVIWAFYTEHHPADTASIFSWWNHCLKADDDWRDTALSEICSRIRSTQMLIQTNLFRICCSGYQKIRRYQGRIQGLCKVVQKMLWQNLSNR